jgi:hypothetical protein
MTLRRSFFVAFGRCPGAHPVNVGHHHLLADRERRAWELRQVSKPLDDGTSQLTSRVPYNNNNSPRTFMQHSSHANKQRKHYLMGFSLLFSSFFILHAHHPHFAVRHNSPSPCLKVISTWRCIAHAHGQLGSLVCCTAPRITILHRPLFLIASPTQLASRLSNNA